MLSHCLVLVVGKQYVWHCWFKIVVFFFYSTWMYYNLVWCVSSHALFLSAFSGRASATAVFCAWCWGGVVPGSLCADSGCGNRAGAACRVPTSGCVSRKGRGSLHQFAGRPHRGCHLSRFQSHGKVGVTVINNSLHISQFFFYRITYKKLNLVVTNVCL